MINNAIFYDDEKPVKLKKWNKAENRISVIDQAGEYVNFVKENKLTTLYLFPVSKGNSANCNMFRLYVFNLLSGNNVDFIPVGYTATSWREMLAGKMLEMKYTVVDYMPE